MQIDFDKIQFCRPWLDQTYRANPEKSFPAFVEEVLEPSFPGLQRFAPDGGADGAIDLMRQVDGGIEVFECKCIGGDQDQVDAAWAWTRVKAEWANVEKRLERNLAGGKAARAQYAPWVHPMLSVVAYRFCVTAWPANAQQVLTLESTIREAFKRLARITGLAHLGAMDVQVISWDFLLIRLKSLPGTALHWFPNTRPRGITPLDCGEQALGFARYLREIPYFSPAQYAQAADFELPAEIQQATTTGILSRLEPLDSVCALITGPGGVGKTRLMMEVGREAKRAGWAVLVTAGADLKNAVADDLFALAGRSQHPILLLVDYVEQAEDLGGFLRMLSGWRDGQPIRVVANCRTTAYHRRLASVDGMEVVDLSQLRQSGTPWLDGYGAWVVDEILRWGKIQPAERHRRQCHGVPVLAVFMAHTFTKNGSGALEDLLKAKDFGAWLSRRAATRFGTQSGDGPLAVLLALLPAFYLPDAPEYDSLIQWLEADGWIYRDSQDRICSIHDVVVDRMLIAEAAGSPMAAERLVDKILAAAENHGGLPSVLRSLERVSDLEPFDRLNWSAIIERRCARSPNQWQDVRAWLFLSSPLLPAEVVALLRHHPALLDGAEADPLYRLALGLAARAPAEVLASDPATRQWLITSMLSAASHCGADDYLITSGLRLDPDAFRQPALDWLGRNPLVMQTHYVLVAWLEQRLPVQTIHAEIYDWAQRFRRDSHFSFLFRAFARHGGQVQVLARSMQDWLKEYGQRPEASHVYKVWLDAGGGVEPVADGLAKWVDMNCRLPEASYVYRGWLNAGGGTEVIAAAVSEWLDQHRLLPEASYIYHAWLDAGGGAEAVAEAVTEWLALHRLLPEANYVYRGWLDAGGGTEAVATALTEWLAQHRLLPEASYVYRGWLHAGGGTKAVAEAVTEWLALHRLLPEASYVYRGWLDAGAGTEAVAAAVTEWLALHRLLPEANYVYRGWLDAGGGTEAVAAAVTEWLALHRLLPEASYVYQGWLDARGDFDLVGESLFQWLSGNRTNRDARYLQPAVLRQPDLPTQTLADILAWCRAFPEDEDTPARLARLALPLNRIGWQDYCIDPVEQCWRSHCHAASDEAVQGWLFLVANLQSLMVAGNARRRVDQILAAWLRHPDFCGTHLPVCFDHRFGFLIMRFSSMLNEGVLDPQADAPHLARLMEWWNRLPPCRDGWNRLVGERLTRRFCLATRP